MLLNYHKRKKTGLITFLYKLKLLDVKEKKNYQVLNFNFFLLFFLS